MARPKKEQPNRADNLYEVKVNVGTDALTGKPIRKSFYSSVSKADAREKGEEYKRQEELKSYGIIESNNQSFKSFALSYLDTVKGTVKANTYNLTYKNCIENHIVAYFSTVTIQQIKQIDIQKYFTLKANDLSKETLKKHKQCLYRIFETAIDNDIIEKNPVRNIKIPDLIHSEEKNTYTEEQAAKILEYAEQHRYGLAVTIMLGYGLSRSELLGLKYEDVDYEKLTLSIKRGVIETPDLKTGKLTVIVGQPKNDFRKREIPITSKLCEQIKATYKPNKAFIISNRFGKVCHPRTWYRRQYDVFMNDMHEYFLSQEEPIDIPKLNPHELRHTRATLWVNDGLNLFAISNVLGWGDLKMLKKRYAHRDIESTRGLLNIKK